MLEYIWWLIGKISPIMLISLIIGGGLAGAAGGLGLNIWPSVAVALSVLVATTTFLWGVNRYAHRALPLRLLMGIVFGVGSWATVAWVLVANWMGWEPVVTLQREVPWGFPVVEGAGAGESRELFKWDYRLAEGDKALDDTAAVIRMWLAALPTPELLQQGRKALETGGVQEAMRFLQQLKPEQMGRGLPPLGA